MKDVANVIEIALALPLVDRSYVASKLIESLEKEELSDGAVAEYDKRVANWKSGASASATSEELEAKVQAILNA